MRSFIVAAVTSTLFLASGCGEECTPEPDITVSFEPDVEEVHALPILPSGAVNLLGTEVPDSHGVFTLNARITNADSVVSEELSMSQAVDGQPLAIQPTRVQQNDQDIGATEAAQNGGKFRFAWRAKNLADYLLPEGKSYTSTVKMLWRFAGCRTQTGTAEAQVVGAVKPTNSLKNITVTAAEAGRVDVLRGIKTKMTVASAVTNDQLIGLTPKYTLTFFDEGLPPTLGYGFADKTKIAMQANGSPHSVLNPGESIEVYTSTNPFVGGAPYDVAGQAASTDTLVGPGRAVVKLELQSQRASASTTQTDVFYTLVDVP